MAETTNQKLGRLRILMRKPFKNWTNNHVSMINNLVGVKGVPNPNKLLHNPNLNPDNKQLVKLAANKSLKFNTATGTNNNFNLNQFMNNNPGIGLYMRNAMRR
jgi:hypothetical protein